MIPGVHELLAGVLDAAEAGLSEPAGRVLVAPGAEVAWDACCDGMLWVRLVEVREGLTRPARLASGEPCGPGSWLLRVGVGVLRCSPSVSDRGVAPSAGALTDNAARVVSDCVELLAAVRCAGGVTRMVEPVGVPLGPEGGCAGGEWVFGVELVECGCDAWEGGVG